MIGLSHYLTVAAILFTLGVLGIFINRKNIIVILMSIELILLSVNINLVAFSAHLGDLVGQVFTLFVLAIAAAEAAVALASSTNLPIFGPIWLALRSLAMAPMSPAAAPTRSMAAERLPGRARAASVVMSPEKTRVASDGR